MDSPLSQGAAARTHVPWGVRWARRIAVALAAAGLVQLLLQVTAGGDVELGLLGGFQAVAAAALAVLWWTRGPMTRVDATGIAVRDRSARPVQHRWEDVTTVVPDGPTAADSTLHLRDGRVVRLPGVVGEAARRLAAEVAERQHP